MITNWRTIETRIATLKKYEKMEEDGTFDVLPKKEVTQIKKEMEKLTKNLGGIKEMGGAPDMIFVVDPRKERICIQEAHALPEINFIFSFPYKPFFIVFIIPFE